MRGVGDFYHFTTIPARVQLVPFYSPIFARRLLPYAFDQKFRFGALRASLRHALPLQMAPSSPVRPPPRHRDVYTPCAPACFLVSRAPLLFTVLTARHSVNTAREFSTLVPPCLRRAHFYHLISQHLPSWALLPVYGESGSLLPNLHLVHPLCIQARRDGFINSFSLLAHVTAHTGGPPHLLLTSVHSLALLPATRRP